MGLIFIQQIFMLSIEIKNNNYDKIIQNNRNFS